MTLNKMEKAFQTLKSHPGCVICYILYALFCYTTVDFAFRFNADFDHIQPGKGVIWGGQGELFGIIFTFIIAIMFIVVMIFNALLRKTGQNFYWWMCIFIVVPLFILMGVSYLSH